MYMITKRQKTISLLATIIILSVSQAEAVVVPTGPAGPAGPQGLQGIPGPKGAAGPAGTGPVGTAKGDMQWWNGRAWVGIKVGANNTTLKNCDGIPTWVADHCGFIIGDTGPAGGKVFYLTDAAGKHGLEAAPADQTSGIRWDCFGKIVNSASGTAIGTGKANTAHVIPQCGIDSAASVAATYALNGYSDWYLPSKDELALLYAQKNKVSSLYRYFYWSSTVVGQSAKGTYALNFADGTENTNRSN